MIHEKIEALFSKLIRKYLELTFSATLAGVGVSLCLILVKPLFLIPLIFLLAWYYRYTTKWLCADMPNYQKDVKLYYSKGFLKYSLLSSLMIIAISQRVASVFVLLILVGFSSYVYDALHISILINAVEKEVVKNNSENI